MFNDQHILPQTLRKRHSSYIKALLMKDIERPLVLNKFKF